jgi:hypothetical protein
MHTTLELELQFNFTQPGGTHVTESSYSAQFGGRFLLDLERGGSRQRNQFNFSAANMG